MSEILERLTMKDILLRYHDLGIKSRTKCPFHNGNDNNFCYTDHVYHCWVCGEKGNVFSFVKKLYNLDTQQTISKIDYDFGLCLPIREKLTLRQKRDFKQKENIRTKEIALKQAEKQEKKDLYWLLWDEWIRLDINKCEYAPISPESELHPLFVEACHKVDYQNYLINCLI